MTLRALDFTIDLLIADLYSGAGGSAMGLYRGFIERYPGLLIVGIDIKPQPHYPAFHDAPYAKHFHFVQGDALNPPFDLSEFDFIWASPVCKRYSHMSNSHPERIGLYPDQIADVRLRLVASGKPFVIENVVGAPLLYLVTLCGTMFDLRVYRHRRFESSQLLLQPQHIPHRDKTPKAGTRGEKAISPKGFICVAGHFSQTNYARKAMGIDWMTQGELSQSIPPAYSEFIARQIRPYPEAR